MQNQPSADDLFLRLPLAGIDAFADRPFTGNPAAVCLLDHERDDAWLQAVAAEMNLSETAFLLACGDEFGLRWFTPVAEVDLCGHATLASAHFLWSSGRLAADRQARFFSRSGLLTAERSADGKIWLDFPATPTTPIETSPGAGDGLQQSLEQALGIEAVAVERSRFDVLVEVGDAEQVRALQPDMTALEKVDVRGIIVTAAGGPPGIDFVSRFFAPRVGVPEDPVTGSAHCALAPYWQRRLGQSEFRARQLSKRDGEIDLRIRPGADGRSARVSLGGSAITVWEGELLAPR